MQQGLPLVYLSQLPSLPQPQIHQNVRIQYLVVRESQKREERDKTLAVPGYKMQQNPVASQKVLELLRSYCSS